MIGSVLVHHGYHGSKGSPLRIREDPSFFAFCPPEESASHNLEGTPNLSGESMYLAACKVAWRSMHLVKSYERFKFFKIQDVIHFSMFCLHFARFGSDLLWAGQACSTRSPAVTRLTVYRRLQVLPAQGSIGQNWAGRNV